MFDMNFYKNRRVFITGHTGFKGTWLSKILTGYGAVVMGYAKAPPTIPSLFYLIGMDKKMQSVIGDIRDYNLLSSMFKTFQPEIVVHLAAQPIVRESYVNPVYTYETNVMGTVHILECIRQTDSVRSFVNVTTDKVYENKEWEWGYRESDRLNGFDPYSNSKSCSELVTQSYINSFFKDGDTAVSTARAGNVIGGGDFASDRIIPDCVRAVLEKKDIIVRNPYSIRPYQHVLEPIYAYLMIASMQYENQKYAGVYNVGPEDGGCSDTGSLVGLFMEKWGAGTKWVSRHDGGPHEAGFLRLDCSKLKSVFGWKPRWTLEKAVEMTVAWYKEWLADGDLNRCMEAQIDLFFDILSRSPAC